MTKTESEFPGIDETLKDTHSALQAAAEVLGIIVDPQHGEMTINVRGGEPYDHHVLQTQGTLAFMTEIQVWQHLEELKKRNDYSKQDIDCFASEIATLVLRIQHLSVLAAMQHIYKGWSKFVESHPQRDAMVKNKEEFAEILKALLAAGVERVSRLSELYSVPGMPKSALKHFLHPELPTGNDRTALLRSELKRTGHYKGKPGRPAKSKNRGD